MEYRLLAEGRLLNGEGPPDAEAQAPGPVTASEGRGDSLNTISAKESMLAERCRALLSLRLQRNKTGTKNEKKTHKPKAMKHDEQLNGFWRGFP